VPTKSAADETTSAGKAGKAPLIIFGTMVVMSIITVAIVFLTHAGRTEPYLQSKMRRVVYKQEARSNALSLNYAAFGPQAMAYEVIGNQWWQWQSSAGIAPPEDYDIKVIVHRDATDRELTKHFPLIKEKRMDPRYLKYDDAIAYLDKHIAEDDVMPELSVRLRATRAKLVAHFDR
jgi:hypothetical protein